MCLDLTFFFFFFSGLNTELIAAYWILGFVMMYVSKDADTTKGIIVCLPDKLRGNL